MAAAGIAFCPTEGDSYRRIEEDPVLAAHPIAQRFRARQALIRAARRRLLAAGAPMLSGIDAGVPTRPFGDYPRDLGALIGEDGLGLTPHQILVSATSGAAAILGLADTGASVPLALGGVA
ncbi:hypothetical protein [Sporichthya sp.]|uniref:hypothetical protein n=1 Tax=Sporichthya sp. TaxID=65475 RepID=UPI00180E7607|nr:hypothetical protein [Sporichthya sp.]MBA3744091.1 hypothetical protein [Sporichthya sp.]